MTGPTLSLAEAARSTGRSTTTLRRWIDTGRLVDVDRTSDGGYRIPLASLIASGLTPRTTPADTPSTSTPTPADTSEVERLRSELDAAHRAELDRLRSEVTDLRGRLDRRDAEVERLLDTLGRMTRALPPAETTSTPTPADTPSPSTTRPPTVTEAGRELLRRWRGDRHRHQ